MADLPLTVLSETPTQITLGWTPPSNCVGYSFHVNDNRVSNTWNPAVNKVTFNKVSGGVYRVRALNTLAEGVHPPSTPPTPIPPSGVKLLWAPPVLSSPQTRTLTNAARSVPGGTGQDLRLVFGEKLTGTVGEIRAYRNVVMIGGEFVGGTQGDETLVPRECVGGTFHIEGIKFDLSKWESDAITPRWRTRIVQIEGCWIEVTDNGSSMHADAFQTQHSILDELRVDRCTIKTDYQGTFLSNEPALAGAPARSKVGKTILSRVLFLKGKMGLPSTFFFKAFPPRPNADPIGPVDMFNVWMPREGGPQVYPHAHSWKGWDGSNNKYGSFVETKRHANGNTYPFLRFSTAADKVPAGQPLAGQPCGDCQIGGDGGIWLYNSPSDVPANLNIGAPADAGMAYVSPGYQ